MVTIWFSYYSSGMHSLTQDIYSFVCSSLKPAFNSPEITSFVNFCCTYIIWKITTFNIVKQVLETKVFVTVFIVKSIIK